MKHPIDRRALLGTAPLAAAAMALGGTEADAQSPGASITVHVLDLFSGTPAGGVKIDLFMRQGDKLVLLTSVTTYADGRPESGPVLSGEAFSLGRYMIVFHLADYFKRIDKTLPANFFRQVSMEFEVTDAGVPLHIPLQCTPWTQACSVLPGG